ncbi:MAG: hypothetical protein QXK07_07895 [Desulfurococcaceae archaeon]
MSQVQVPTQTQNTRFFVLKEVKEILKHRIGGIEVHGWFNVDDEVDKMYFFIDDEGRVHDFHSYFIECTVLAVFEAENKLYVVAIPAPQTSVDLYEFEEVTKQ